MRKGRFPGKSHFDHSANIAWKIYPSEPEKSPSKELSLFRAFFPFFPTFFDQLFPTRDGVSRNSSWIELHICCEFNHGLEMIF